MKQRLKINIRGAVQGVGFRPFIYRLAADMDIKGYVFNHPGGVTVEAEAGKEVLDGFLLRIEKEKPPHSMISGMEFLFLDPAGFNDFRITESSDKEDNTALILPDIAVCGDCLAEMYNPADRRYLYPFINCTNCGPRFSIIGAIPYDRRNTSMNEFIMCEDCRREYEDPGNRRFHAEPVACPECGPHIELWDGEGNILRSHNEALKAAAVKIREGEILAMKGIGGFQLIADATKETVLESLRERKKRVEKPFALMFPDINSVKLICSVSPMEERLLRSPEAPIVLLRKKIPDHNVPFNIAGPAAPGNPYIGVMLPYSPLHHLLMKELGFPVVATSANISEEPIITDEKKAVEKMAGIAGYYLVNNRKILRHADDSVARVIMGREMLIRRARGYAPLPVASSENNSKMISAGGHLKNTVSVKSGGNIILSQYIGDLSTLEAENTFVKVIDDFRKIYNIDNGLAVTDLHPDYISTKFARENFRTTIAVQHHAAHAAACIAENGIEGDVLGISWDGAGYGCDGTVWGGEFFIFDSGGIKHAGQLRRFLLPGGDAASMEPRRSALGLLYELYGEDVFGMDFGFLKAFSVQELNTLRSMLVKKINTQYTTSAGRIFDAVAALLSINYKMNYEGQAAMMLEFLVKTGIEDSYPFDILDNEIKTNEIEKNKIIKNKFLMIDWGPAIRELLSDINKDVQPGVIAARFHNTMAEMISSAAGIIGKIKIALSGGVFQNAYLLERAVFGLEAHGFKPYWNQRIPTNDGGISAGQIYAVLKYGPKNGNIINHPGEIICASPYREK